MKQPPITVGPSDKESLSIAGGTYRILVSGKETGGAFATIEMTVPPGGGPGPHSHADFQESFYVIEGEVEVRSQVDTSEVDASQVDTSEVDTSQVDTSQVDTTETDASQVSVYTAGKGSFIVIPKGGVVHCFKNKSDKPALLLCIVVPSGLEEMFEAMGKPVAGNPVAGNPVAGNPVAGNPVDAGTVATPPPMNADAMEKMKALAEKYGQKLYPPDYLD